MTSPEIANVLKKYVTSKPLRFGGPLSGNKQTRQNRKDFEELQALALKDMKAFNKKLNDMKAKQGDSHSAVRQVLAKAGLSKHITDEHRIEGDEIMNEKKIDENGAGGSAAGRKFPSKLGKTASYGRGHGVTGKPLMQSYKDKFNAQMKKSGINSLDDLKTDAEKKAFFKAVDKSHTAKNEENLREAVNEGGYDSGSVRQPSTAPLPGGTRNTIPGGKRRLPHIPVPSMDYVGALTASKTEGGPGSGPQFSSATIKKAYGILNDPRYKQGNYSGAAKAIEKLGKGLSSHPDVKNALKRANESLSEEHDCENEHPGKSHDAWTKSKEKNEMKDLEPNAKEINAMVKDPHKSKEGNPKDDLLAQWSDASVKADVKKKGGDDMSKVKDAPKPEEALRKVTASYESKKYHDIKPGSIQDTVMQMQVNEQKFVTIRVPEFSKLIETYLLKGGVIDTTSVDEDVDLDEEINALPLQEVRDFITTYNKWFLTNYKAEEFIVQVEEDVSPGHGNSRRGDAPKKVGTFTKIVKKVAKGITKVIEPAKNFIQGKGYAFDK